MPAGIPTSNILQPGAISQPSQLRQLMVDLQILKPQWYKNYVEKYGNEDFTWWLATYAGMEEVKNQQYFWFENRGKLMVAVTNLNAVNAPAAGATVTVQIIVGDHFDLGALSPLRVGETVRIASNHVEGKILTINETTPNAHTCTIRPLQTTQAFASPSGNLDANEILIFAGDTEAGEASTQINPLEHLDKQYLNTITEIRDGWSNSDLAQMAETYYEFPVSGDLAQNGVTAFTYKGMFKTLTRFKNNVEAKLMFGDVQTNTGLNTSVGAQGLLPKLFADAETLTYTPPTLDFAKMHELTRIMDVNGCDKQCAWLMDVFQSQQFSDGIFNELPAGAFVWGQGEKSEEASMAYGFKQLYIDDYMLMKKKYVNFNTEVMTGKTPNTDLTRNFGIIYPMGTTRDAKSAQPMKNLTVMYQQPPVGGTIGNAIRLWQYGGGSPNPTDGTMTNQLAMITYRSLRCVSANKFVVVESN